MAISTLGQIASDIAKVWGYPNFGSVPSFGQERIRIDINAAIQQMQDAGEDFYGREDVVIDLVENQSEYVLAQELQTVLEPVVLQDGTVLSKLTSQGQVLNYGQLFLNRLDNVVTPGKPKAYFVDANKMPASEDNVRTILTLLPAPSLANVGNKLVVPMIKEANIFSSGELTAGTATLPVPHKYIDSIFLPLARYNATTCYLFYDKAKAGKYESDYSRALKLLGQADPRQNPKPPESNTNALQVKTPQAPSG